MNIFVSHTFPLSEQPHVVQIWHLYLRLYVNSSPSGVTACIRLLSVWAAYLVYRLHVSLFGLSCLQIMADVTTVISVRGA